MYIPAHFAETDEEPLFRWMEERPFAVLVGVRNGLPFATHLPLMLDRERRSLFGHVARANPHTEMIAAGIPQMVLFNGPHAYISPRHYVSTQVPTWNYIAVHATGTPRAITEPQESLEVLMRLTRHFEGGELPPLPDSDQLVKLNRAILAFEIPIQRLEGKFKLSQNRSEEDRRSVIHALSGQNNPEARAVADGMRTHDFER